MTEADGDGAPDPRIPLELADLSDLSDLVVRVDHAGIAVPDLDAAVELYATFGLRLEHREVNHDQQVAEAMLIPSRKLAPTEGLAPGGLAPGDGLATRTRVQLIAPLDASSPIARFLDRSGPGLQQLALTVTDVVLAAERLRRREIRVLYPEPRRGTAGTMINFVHPKDAGGVLLELVQHPAPSDPAESLV